MRFTCSLALALTLPALAGDFRYSVTVLEPIGDHYRVDPTAINNRGEVVGVSVGSPIDNQVPFIYRPGTGLEPLPLPPGYAFSVPMDINDNGVIVGFAQPTWSAEQSMVAWKYEDGTFTMYPGVSLGVNINNVDTIVGRACLSDLYLTCYFQAAPGDPMQTVGPAFFYSSSRWRMIDINDSGQILYTPPGASGPGVLRQPDGSLVQLPPPPQPFQRTHTWAINNSAQALARWEYNIGSQYFSRAFIWSEASGATEIGVPNNYVFGSGLNNLGQAVGRSGSNQNSYLDIWIWTPERGTENLEPLVDPALQLILTNSYGINDAGQILAQGISQIPPSPTLQFILTPVPRCRADFDGDGFVTGVDFDLFVQAFESGDMNSDFDGDGFITGVDFDSFVQSFESGC